MTSFSDEIKKILAEKYSLNEISIATIQQLMKESTEEFVAVLFENEIYLKNGDAQLTKLADHFIYDYFDDLVRLQKGELLHNLSKNIPARTFYLVEKIKMLEKEKELKSNTSIENNSKTLSMETFTEKIESDSDQKIVDEENIHQIDISTIDSIYTTNIKALKYLPNVEKRFNKLTNEIFITEVASSEMDYVIKALSHICRNGSLDNFDMASVGDITYELIDCAKFLGFYELYNELMATLQLVVLDCTKLKKIVRNTQSDYTLPQMYINCVSMNMDKDNYINFEIIIVSKDNTTTTQIVDFHIKDVLPISSNTIKLLNEKHTREDIILEDFPNAFVVDDSYLPNTIINEDITDQYDDLSLPIHRYLVVSFDLHKEEKVSISNIKFRFYPVEEKKNNCAVYWN